MSEPLPVLLCTTDNALSRHIQAVLQPLESAFALSVVEMQALWQCLPRQGPLFLLFDSACSANVAELTRLAALPAHGSFLVLLCPADREAQGVEAMQVGFDDYLLADNLTRLTPLVQRWLLTDAGSRLPSDDLQRAHAALLKLARSQTFQGENLIDDLHEITEVAGHALNVARASIWMCDAAQRRIRCIDLFEPAKQKHSDGSEILFEDHPGYFLALAQQRLVVANDARHDPRTAAYTANYLIPLGITSMLDVAVRQRGELVGVICLEHVGPLRVWTREEEVFACVFADLVSLALEATRRQLHEADLRQELTRLRQTFENTSEAIAFFEVLTPRRLVLESLNPAGQRLLREHAAGAVGKSLVEVLPAEVSEALMPALQWCLESGQPSSSEQCWPAAAAPAKPQWLQAVLVPSRHPGQPVHRLAIFWRDVTERKAFEEALFQREEMFCQFLATTGVIPWEADHTTGRFTFVGAQAEKLLRFPIAMWYQENFWADHLLPEDRESVVRAFWEQSRRVNEFTLEYRMIDRDGGVVWVHDLVNVVRDPRGKLWMRGFLVDVTARRQAEESLRQLNAELERRVSERTRQLEAANRELEAFSYSVSHDLRGPLRAVDGFARALLEDYEDQLDSTGRDMLRRVRLASQRMGELIDDLLQLSRATRAEMRSTRINLSSLASAIAARLRGSRPEHPVEWVIAPDLMVTADAALMGVVLDNLLGNAFKYSGKKASARIELNAQTTASGREFFVRDNGAGFDPTYADKLFQPFQRLHHSDEFEGHGIGLAIVAWIVQRRGGRVRAEGKVDQGATFYFTLPEV